jgi:hypothetical protein
LFVLFVCYREFPSDVSMYICIKTLFFSSLPLFV